MKHKGLACDHFYSNAPLINSTVDPTDLSDHYAIVTELVLDEL